jgi:hypothetical protein
MSIIVKIWGCNDNYRILYTGRMLLKKPFLNLPSGQRKIFRNNYHRITIYVFYNLCMQLTRKLFEIVIYIIIYHRHPKYNNNSIYIYFELRFNLRKTMWCDFFRASFWKNLVSNRSVETWVEPDRILMDIS